MEIQIPCLANCQTGIMLRLMEAHGVPAETQLQILRDHNRMILDADENDIGVMMSDTYRLVINRLGLTDPLAAAKREHNATALELLPLAREIIAGQADPLYAAVKFAAVGNMIDFAFGDVFDIETAVRGCTDLRFEIDDYPLLLDRLASAESLVMLHDNAGEIVFDRLLLEEIRRWREARGLPPLAMTSVVKGGPAMNDALRTDADMAGIPGVATVLDTGCQYIGFPPSKVCPDTAAIVRGCDILLSKGLGNFETISDHPEYAGHAFYILKAKCSVVAGALGVPLQCIVLAAGGGTRKIGCPPRIPMGTP